MTQKEMFSRFGLLAFWLLIAIGMHVATIVKVESIAERYSPTYVPMAKEIASSMVNTDCKNDSSIEIYDSDIWTSKRFESSAKNSTICNAIQRRDAGGNSDEFDALIDNKLRAHRWAWKQREVGPRAEKFEEGFHIAFSMSYAVIALYALLALKQWFFSNGRQALNRRVAKLGTMSGISGRVSDIAANHKMRKAQADFQTLKSLHENGLITDEVFAKRKDALRAGLDDSESSSK